MHLKIHLRDLDEILLEQTVERRMLVSNEPVIERVTTINLASSRGTYREILLDGIHIGYGDLRLKQTTLLQFESDFETVEMHFDLCGQSEAAFREPGVAPYQFSSNTHNLIYVPGTKGTMHLNASPARILEINIRPSVFEHYLSGSDHHRLAAFRKHMQHQQHSLLSRHNLPISPAMHHVIEAIVNCSKTGVYKKLFLEAKVIELLMLQLEQLLEHDCEVCQHLRPQDYEKMHHAKAILLTHLDDPYSLTDLARQIGTNEFTLKKGFKELFGTSVFGMLSDERMKKAQTLLLNTTKSVAEISQEIGYKYPHHFNAAFKKKFGVPPGRYKSFD